jgi:hypothetical protein
MTSRENIQSGQISYLYGVINSGAIPVYPPANDIVTITGNQTITGDKVFTGTVNAPTVNVLDDSTSVATTEWVKDYVPTITGGFVTASANNVFTGINSFVNPITPTITTFDGIDMSGNDITNGGTFTATTFVGDLSGNATNISATNTSTNATFYPTFVSASGSGQTIGIDTTPQGLNYNPSTNMLNTKTFSATDSAFANVPDTTITNTGIIVNNSFSPNISNTTISSNSITLQQSPNTTTITPASITSPLFIGDLSGNSTTATTATNIAGGIASQIPYQSGANTTAFIANGTTGQFLKSNGTSAPSWDNPVASTIDITNTETNADFYPTFVSASGAGQTLRADITTTPFSFNPSTGRLQRTSTTSATNIPLIISSSNSPASKVSQIDLNSGSNVIAPVGTFGSYIDSQNDTKLILSTDTDLRRYYTDGTIDYYAGVKTYTDTATARPATLLYHRDDAPSTTYTGVRVVYNTISMFAGSTENTATNIASFNTGGISFSQVLSFSSAGQGVLEKSLVSTAGATLTTANAFQTIVSSTASVRTYVLPAPTAGTAGYWYGFCNKATSAGNTIIVQYPSGTTLFTLAGGVPTIGNCARVAVVAGGASYFSPSQ